MEQIFFGVVVVEGYMLKRRVSMDFVHWHTSL